jgi:hypothetical protein
MRVNLGGNYTRKEVVDGEFTPVYEKSGLVELEVNLNPDGYFFAVRPDGTVNVWMADGEFIRGMSPSNFVHFCGDVTRGQNPSHDFEEEDFPPYAGGLPEYEE